MFKVIGRNRRPIAHFKHRRHRLDPPGQQQGQGRRAIGGITGLEVIARNATLGIETAIHFHQLRRTFGLPHMLLFTGQLHPHRQAHSTGQQHRIGTHVIGTVAPITSCRFHANNFDLCFRVLQQPGQVSAQQVRVLRARPHAYVLGLIVRQPAGRADGTMNLIRPQVAARHSFSGLLQCLLHIALVQNNTLDTRVVTNSLLDIRHVGEFLIPGFPRHRERLCGFYSLLFTQRHHAHKVADHHHFDHAGNMRNG